MMCQIFFTYSSVITPGQTITTWNIPFVSWSATLLVSSPTLHIKATVKCVCRSQLEAVHFSSKILYGPHLHVWIQLLHHIFRIPKLCPQPPALPAVILATLGLHTSWQYWASMPTLAFCEGVPSVCHLDSFFIYSTSLPSFHHIRKVSTIIKKPQLILLCPSVNYFITFTIWRHLSSYCSFCLPLDYNFVKVHIYFCPHSHMLDQKLVQQSSEIICLLNECQEPFPL